MTPDRWFPEHDEGGDACTPGFDPVHCSCWQDQKPCCFCGDADGPNECPTAVSR